MTSHGDQASHGPWRIPSPAVALAAPSVAGTTPGPRGGMTAVSDPVRAPEPSKVTVAGRQAGTPVSAGERLPCSPATHAAQASRPEPAGDAPQVTPEMLARWLVAIAAEMESGRRGTWSREYVKAARIAAGWLIDRPAACRPAERPTSCAWCGARLPVQRQGRPRRFCGRVCGLDYHHEARRVERSRERSHPRQTRGTTHQRSA